MHKLKIICYKFYKGVVCKCNLLSNRMRISLHLSCPITDSVCVSFREKKSTVSPLMHVARICTSLRIDNYAMPCIYSLKRTEHLCYSYSSTARRGAPLMLFDFFFFFFFLNRFLLVSSAVGHVHGYNTPTPL